VLAVIPRDTLQTMNRPTKHKTESQSYSKLKEVQANAQSQCFAPHLILPKRTKAHPPPKDKYKTLNYKTTK